MKREERRRHCFQALALNPTLRGRPLHRPAIGRQASPSHLTATTGAGSRTDGMGRSNGILSPRADTPHAVEVDPSLGVETAQCAHPNPDGCSVAAAAAARGGFGWMMLS